MLHRWLIALRNAPLGWTAFAVGLLVFMLTRSLPGASWSLPAGEQVAIDNGFVEALRGGAGNYEVIKGIPQTFGPHVLPRYAVATVSRITGDAARAGIWLSLCGVTATIGAVYALCRAILPLRGYAFITLIAMGGLGTLQYAVSPDPSLAMGMALVIWGVVFFISALEGDAPARVFLSAMFIGIAAYIRLELALLWVILAAYLILLSFFRTAATERGIPLVAMALGGLLMIAMILWPLVNRNLMITRSTAILPGADAEMILGAPRAMGRIPRVNVIARILQGFRVLILDPAGPGVFAGLLWPLGIGLSTVINRRKCAPVLWLPLVMGSVVFLAILSMITGPSSYEECMRVLTPLLLPFATLGPVYVLFRWMQAREHTPIESRRAWLLTGLIVYLIIQVPHAFRRAFVADAAESARMQAVVEAFGNLSREDLEAKLLTDRPGLFLAAGKSNVYGLHGETDWSIHTTKYANASVHPREMVRYLQRRGIALIHLTDVMNPLIDELSQVEGAPKFQPITGFSPPHRVYRVSWP